MAKKIFSLILMFGVILSTSVAMAANYPKYLNGDRNYILCDGIQGVAIYAIRNSLKVERYNPPNYIISIDVTENGRMTHRFAYKKKFWGKYGEDVYPED